MLGAQSSTTKIVRSEEHFITSLINHHQYAEAYQFLIKESQLSSVTHFNTALCLIYSRNYHQALTALDSAYSLLSVSSLHAEPRTEQYTNIMTLQNASDSYKNPVITQYITSFPAIFKDAILRLKVDCYLKLEEWHKVLDTGSKINKYKNVSDALTIAKQRLEIL